MSADRWIAVAGSEALCAGVYSSEGAGVLGPLSQSKGAAPGAVDRPGQEGGW